MTVDPSLIKTLNLIRNQPTFVFRESNEGELFLESVNPIPADNGFYWVAGITKFKSNHEAPSVFVVDTDSGAEQCNVYWFVDGDWYEHSESKDVARALGIEVSDMFPYSWQYEIPIEGDIHT